MVRRIYVEKKQGFDVEAKGLLSDIRENLGISGVSKVRMLNRYDMDGIDDSLYEEVKTAVFAEPAIDKIYEESIDISDADYSFATEYLPGQYDQRSDSAAQCIQLISMEQRPEVRSAKVVLLYGDLTQAQGEEVRDYPYG